MAKDLAIDLGTTTIQVIVRGSGLVVDELTVVACEQRSREPIAFGRDAIAQAEAEPERIELIWPVRNGAADNEMALQQLLARIIKPQITGLFERARVVMTVPSDASPFERRSVREAVRRAGASSVHLIEHGMAAALGADLPIHEPIGTCVVDVGAGVTEAALISVGSVVAASSVRSGSVDVDLGIKHMLRREYGMVISDRSAEHIKLAAGRMQQSEGQLIEARGTMTLDGSTMTAILERNEVQPVLDLYLTAAEEAVRMCLIQAPPELSQDLLTQGLYLCGGGALLGGLADRLAQSFNLPVHVIPNPDRVVVNGAGKCLESMDTMKPLFIGED
jgi:rod shape-determining protein MreB and related proteins